MARKFRELIDAMPVERRKRIEAEAHRLEAEMRLRELRNARDLSQADLADALEIVVHFPDRDMRITQFRELRRSPSPRLR